MNERDFYLNAINELAVVTSESDKIINELNSYNSPIKCESRLDGWDYCYAIALGLSGAFITTSQKLDEYLADIHKAASESAGDYDCFQKLMGRLLHHKGDFIDKVDASFKNRSGDNAYGLFHRLLWGHDVISINKDNPFYLMFQQKGMTGIVQAVRHLLADTLSKQGLPSPGSSLLDYIDENQKNSNYLIKISQELSLEAFDNKAMAQEIYSHMFTIKAQDLTFASVVFIMTIAYAKARKIEDPIRKSEIRLISYFISFWGKAVIGMIRQKGIPYISLPLATAMMTEWVRNDYLYRKRIKQLKTDTDDIVRRINCLERRCFFVEEMIGEDYYELGKTVGRMVNIAKLDSYLNGGE